MVLVIAVSGWVWRTLPHAYFASDDYLHLYQLRNVPLAEYLLTPYQGHARLVGNGLFYAFDRAFGTDASRYFLIVLLTHLLNVGLLFALARHVCGSPIVAAFAALLFGTAPIAGGTLAWYAVYGQAVATTAVLSVLLLAARAAAQRRRLRRGESLAATGLALVATLSFGVGVGLAMTLPFALALVLPTAPDGARWRLPLLGLLVAVPVTYLGSFWLYDRMFAHQSFDDVQTMLAGGAEAWQPGAAILLELVAYGGARLLAGPVPLGGLMLPAMAAAGFALVTASILAVWRGDPHTRRWLVASWMLLLACCATIAFPRTDLIQRFSLSPTVIATQPRYHYASLALLALVTGLVLAAAMPRPPARAGGAVWVLALWMIAWAGAHAVWPLPPFPAPVETTAALAAMRSQIDAAAPGSDVYLRNHDLQAVGPMFIPRREFPGWAGLFVIFFPSNVVSGRRVYFVEPDDVQREQLAHGRRAASLFVAPVSIDAAPGAPPTDQRAPDAPP